MPLVSVCPVCGLHIYEYPFHMAFKYTYRAPATLPFDGLVDDPHWPPDMIPSTTTPLEKLTMNETPLWQQLGIKKFKRDGHVIYQTKRYEIEMIESDIYPETEYQLRHANSKDDDYLIVDLDDLIPFLTVVKGNDVPFVKRPSEDHPKVKALQARIRQAEIELSNAKHALENFQEGYDASSEAGDA